MSYVQPIALLQPRRALSPLMLSDQLIALAEDADRVGLRPAAVRLVQLAHAVLDPTAAEFA